MQRFVHKIALLGILCGLTFSSLPQSTSPTYATDPNSEERVAELMANMTTRQKVGQLFMVTLFGTHLLETNEAFIYEYQPGAVALFGANLDYQSPWETTTLVNEMQAASMDASGIPMLVATDQEGGLVWRLINGFTHFPAPMYLGAMSPEMAYQVGVATGRELSAVGVNMNLAPVVDLTTRSDEITEVRVLHTRTMGNDAITVGTNAGNFTQGMSTSGTIGVIKHYPGHSPTSTDSHADLAQVDMDRSTFEATNLRAFASAIENGAQVVMVGHLYYPAIEPVENLPATLSPTMLGILRHDLGFEGVIMTDAFDMGAIQNNYDVTEAAVLAINAGIDLIAMGPNMAFSKQKLMIEAVGTAVENGDISMERLDDAVRRVLLLKAEQDLLDWTPLDVVTTDERIAVTETADFLEEAFADAVTIVKDDLGALPLRAEDNLAIYYPAGWFEVGTECRGYFPDADYLAYSWDPAQWERGAATQKARDADVVIVFAENLFRLQNQGMRDLINLLPMDKVIFISMGTPYDYELLDNPPAGFIAGYTSLPEAQRAMCRILAGEATANGRLTVELSEFPVGHSIIIER